MGKFVISPTMGAEDPERATVNCTLANSALGCDLQAIVFLSSEGASLAVEGRADHIAEKGSTPLR